MLGRPTGNVVSVVVSADLPELDHLVCAPAQDAWLGTLWLPVTRGTWLCAPTVRLGEPSPPLSSRADSLPTVAGQA